MKPDDFRWNGWNLDHATKHGCSVEEIQSVVRNATRPYPAKDGEGKWVVVGRGTGGRFIQVIYLIDPHPFAYVIHAMPVTPKGRRGRR